MFTSTRQTQSQGVLLDEGKPQFSAQDEARTEPAFVLDVMNADGTDIHQISFNQSHDRDATVLANGRVLWTPLGQRAGQGRHALVQRPIRTARIWSSTTAPTATSTGTNDTVVEFVQPHEMQDGRILALVRQYTDVDFGGDLVIIDGQHYVENTAAAARRAPPSHGPGADARDPQQVLTIPGPSPGGRFNSAYPLWDGTNRILVSWTQCRLLDDTTDAPDDRAVHQPTLAVANPLGGAAALQRVDVRPDRRTPCCRSCSRSKASW